MTNEQITKVTDAAKIEATRLCEQALKPHPHVKETPVYRARARRYQIEEFSRTSAKIERVVCDLLRDESTGDVAVSSRAELLAAIDAYCDAGIAEVERRFRSA
jgi:hypothetical protein